MKMKRTILPLLLVIIGITGCNSPKTRFIADKDIRSTVETQFEKRVKLYPIIKEPIDSILQDIDVDNNKKEALKYLYAYMSLSDVADYKPSFFLKQIELSFAAKDTFEWGTKVPEELFRHFVLPFRVNNEDLDNSREVFFKELKDRIKGMSMADAVLEVNHWCHEKVTYRPADGRTSAPLATVRTAYGRCGEESTFTVAALRSVGIPARQCYTPRWAHTDDNHAWVEVWVDGKWYFIGACEPEPELNMAWFTFPVKRAMMVHTNVFGQYNGKESKTEYKLYTKINVLENYTTTKRLNVTVLDENDKPIEGADVKYLLYNYAEYYPIYSKKSNKNGISYIISGLGDLVVWASKNGKYNYKKVSLKNTDAINIRLNKSIGKEYTEDWNLTPPENLAVFVNDTTAARAENNQRLHYEDSIRNAYLATFMTEKEAIELAKKLNIDKEKTVLYIKKSEGNYAEITKYLTQNSKNKYLFALLSTLTNKDLRDTPEYILSSHLLNSRSKKSDYLSEEVFVEGILSPRISTELIRDWRAILQQNFKGVITNPNANSIKEWVNKNIKVVNDENYAGCLISPLGVLNIKTADRASRNLFYIALCRSLNVPTLIDTATGDIKYFENGEWKTILLDNPTATFDTGILTINYHDKFNSTPQYWIYYTIARYEDGNFRTLDFEGDKRVENFPYTLKLQTGYYRITTGNRYADGRILAHNEYFNINKNDSIAKELVIRELEPDNTNYGKVNSKLITKEMYQENGAVIAFLEPDREPTKHLMNELPIIKNKIDQWRGNFIFVVPQDKQNRTFNSNQYSGLPTKSKFVLSNGTEMMNDMLKSTNMAFRDNYPLVYIINREGEIVFQSEGYRIGVGELIWKKVK